MGPQDVFLIGLNIRVCWEAGLPARYTECGVLPAGENDPISMVGGMREMKRDRFDLEMQLANRCKVQPLHYLRHRADNVKTNHPPDCLVYEACSNRQTICLISHASITVRCRREIRNNQSTSWILKEKKKNPEKLPTRAFSSEHTQGWRHVVEWWSFLRVDIRPLYVLFTQAYVCEHFMSFLLWILCKDKQITPSRCTCVHAQRAHAYIRVSSC